MSLSLTSTLSVRSRAPNLAPLFVAQGAYLLFLFLGNGMLNDPDSYWHIKVGQWILDHRTLPSTDLYSFTRFGEHWISTEWLSQVVFATGYAQWGWAGPVILAAIAIALSAAIFAYLLDAYFESPVLPVLFVILALSLGLPHFLARPHILALPVMVAWSGMLMASAERKSPPFWLWLPLMALWANLHGSFILGLALIGPFALEAVWNVENERRTALFMRWVLFGIGALIASCCTPYGWKTLLGAANILNLGKALMVIAEWRPADFTSFTLFEGALLGLVAIAFYCRPVLSPPRILLVLVLTWMALTHIRNTEVFAFLVPLVLARPLAESLGRARQDASPDETRLVINRHALALGILMIVAAAGIPTLIFTSYHRFTPPPSPVAAVDLLQERKAQRIFNDYGFGGYLISRNIPVFVDGRTELYGKTFILEVNATSKLNNMTRLLDEYRIDATLLRPDDAEPLDHVKGWKRLYADNIAVVHVRDDMQPTAPVRP